MELPQNGRRLSAYQLDVCQVKPNRPSFVGPPVRAHVHGAELRVGVMVVLDNRTLATSQSDKTLGRDCDPRTDLQKRCHVPCSFRLLGYDNLYHQSFEMLSTFSSLYLPVVMSNQNWTEPTQSQFKIIAAFVKAIRAQEHKHVKALLHIIYGSVDNEEDINAVIWVLSGTNRFSRLPPRLKNTALVLHGMVWDWGLVPDSMHTPDMLADVMLGPLVPSVVKKCLQYIERVWFPEIKRTYMAFAAKYQPKQMKEMADVISYFVWSEPYMLGNHIELRTFRPLWVLCRGH